MAALGLGLAGLDPAGALIATAALAAGARDRSVVAFGVLVLLGTAVFGTVLSLTLGARLAGVDWASLLPTGRGGAVLEIVVGVGLLAWAVVRLARRTARAPKPRRIRGGTAGLLGTGVLFVLSAALDPTYVALVVLAGRGEPVYAVAAAHLIWALVSQSPLLLLLLAVLRGGHERAVQRFGAWWQRARPVARRIVTGALVLVGGVLVLDGIWWFATGGFLLPEP